MAAYATTADVESGFRPLTESELSVANSLLDEAAIIIDAYAAADVTTEAKKLVSCKMVRRALGVEDGLTMPLGATQGSISAMGYSQSWTMGSGSGGSGELYLSKLEKKLLKVGNRIGAHSVLENMVIR